MATEVERARRLFTVEEYHRMADAGILKPSDRVELIHGEIIEVSPIGHRHIGCVINLNRLFVIGVGDRAVVSSQNPVVIAPLSEPEPDLLLLRQRPVPYIAAYATENDVLLVIEVADTSLGYDRTVKLRLYAMAGIPEYWIVDANAEAVTIYRAPGPDGYRDVPRVARGGTVAPLAFPDLIIAVADIFA